MKTIARVLSGAVAITTASAVFAQAPAPSYQDPAYRQAAYQDRGAAAAVPQQELDAILAPIALYPDALLSQLLMAATFPQDVAQAAQWSRSNTGFKGDDAVRAVENEPWAPAVKSMVAFPDVLKAMGDQPDWTRRLGEAFLASEANVMQAVQNLRQRADQAGNLKQSEQLAVTRQGDNYALASPSPEQVYVPYYDPRTVYGAWQYPDYQPVYWNPWPGYAYYGGYGFGWGSGIYLSSGFFYGGFDWGRRYVRYAGYRPYYYRGNDYYRGWRNDRHDGRNWNARGNDGRGGWNGNGNGNGRGNDGRGWNGNGNGNGRGNEGRNNEGRGNWNGGDRGQGGTTAGAGRGGESYRPPQRQEGWQNVQRPQRVEESTRSFNPSTRTVAPRTGLEGGGRVVRSATPVQGEHVGAAAQQQRVPTVRNVTPDQRAARGQPRPMPQAIQPNAGVPQAAAAKPMRAAPAAPAAQASQRSFQPQQHQPQQHQPQQQRSGGGENRGGGNRGGGDGNRGRER